MADEIEIEGVQYISSKRASELSGYAQDYIGQLARGGYIKAQRIGGLWHVSLDSLQEYGKSAEAYKPKAPERPQVNDPDSLVSFDGKDYISAARAAKLTGYHQDYVGQLARKGTLISRQVGNRWYVEREGILAHKNEKDRLLGAVQAQSVGLRRPMAEAVTGEGNDLDGEIAIPNKEEPNTLDYSAGYTYTADQGDLVPAVKDFRDDAVDFAEKIEDSPEENPIPIRIEPRRVQSVAYQYQEEEILDHSDHVNRVKYVQRPPRKTIFYGTMAVAALSIGVALYFGFSAMTKSSSYTAEVAQPAESTTNGTQGLFIGSALNALARSGDFLADLIVRELIYIRNQ